MSIDFLRIAASLLVSLLVAVAVIYALSRLGVGRVLRQVSPHIAILETRRVGVRTSLVAVRFRGQDALVVVGAGFATTVLVANAAEENPAEKPSVSLPETSA